MALWLLTVTSLCALHHTVEANNNLQQPGPERIMENIALSLGSAGGFKICGVQRSHVTWVFEYDAKEHYVHRQLYHGSRVPSDNIVVQDTDVGCFQLGFREVNFDHAGYYVLYGDEPTLPVGAFLQVASRSELQEPLSYRFTYSGLMDYDLCNSGADRGVECSCSKDEHALTAVNCEMSVSALTLFKTSGKCFSCIVPNKYDKAATGPACANHDEVAIVHEQATAIISKHIYSQYKTILGVNIVVFVFVMIFVCGVSLMGLRITFSKFYSRRSNLSYYGLI